MLRQILNLTWKEIIQVRRDRFLVLFLILAPTMQLVLLSRNTAQGVRDMPVAILDLDQSALSRELAATLDQTREMKITYRPRTREELNALLDDGKAEIGIVVPPGFERAFYGGGPESAQVQAIIDGTNTLVGRSGAQVIEGVIGLMAQRRLASPLSAESGGRGYSVGLKVLTSALFNPSFNNQWFAIPSMLAFITYQVTLVVAATGFVRERELGTLEQLLITPLNRFELIAGKALPAILIGMFNFFLLLAVQTLGYHIPIRGSLILLLGAALLFIIAVVAQGTLISLLSHTQQQAVLFVFLLAILEVTFSGYLLPVENMPLVMRALAKVSALQHFMVTIRSVTLRGATLPMILPDLLAIVAFTGVVGFASWRLFNRSIE